MYRISTAALAALLAGLCLAPPALAKKNPLREQFLKRAAASYQVKPDIKTCRTGALKSAQKQEALNTINDIRRLHGLAPVTYDSGSDEEVMQASLLFAANRQLSHSPPASWTCYTPAGAQGAASSVIYGGLASPNLSYYGPNTHITGWLTDIDNTMKDNIGHRRWLLDPFLQKIAYGSVQGATDKKTQSGGAALKVIYRDATAPAVASRPIVVYPDGDYPSRYFVKGALLSFAVVASLERKYMNSQVDYSQARITMTERGGGAVTVSKVSFDTSGFGLPNNLQFKPEDVRVNTYYDVTIANVSVAGEVKDYSYWFRIVD